MDPKRNWKSAAGRAIELLKEGKTTLSAVARSVGASKSSVFRWYQDNKRAGPRPFVQR